MTRSIVVRFAFAAGSMLCVIPFTLTAVELMKQGDIIKDIEQSDRMQRTRMNALRVTMKSYAEDYAQFVRMISEVGADAGAHDASTCNPHPEVCNGIDDDCDGLVDEVTSNGRLVSVCPKIDFDQHSSWCLMRESRPGPDGGREKSEAGEPLPDDDVTRQEFQPFTPDALVRELIIRVRADCPLAMAKFDAFRNDEMVALGVAWVPGLREVEIVGDLYSPVEAGDILRLQITASCSSGIGKVGIEKCTVKW